MATKKTSAKKEAARKTGEKSPEATARSRGEPLAPGSGKPNIAIRAEPLHHPPRPGAAAPKKVGVLPNLDLRLAPVEAPPKGDAPEKPKDAKPKLSFGFAVMTPMGPAKKGGPTTMSDIKL